MSKGNIANSGGMLYAQRKGSSSRIPQVDGPVSEPPNEVAKRFRNLQKELDAGDIRILYKIRSTVLQLASPPQLVQEFRRKMLGFGMPWPGDEGEHRWEQAWLAIKKVPVLQVKTFHGGSIPKIHKTQAHLALRSAALARQKPATGFGSNIHTLKHDEDDAPFGDGNGNST
ncbi:hypothetical protein Droror1_Dr00000064 [Drosera rotundifolia]